jgi:uncharacterized HAD superfamily protein
LKNARPKYIPTYKIKTIISSRLEKYRPETEAWLKKHNVKYENLILLDGVTAKERAEKQLHGDFKAQEYQKSEYTLFYESNIDQSRKIASLTGKPVFCVDEAVMISPEKPSTIQPRPIKRTLVYRGLRKIYHKIKGFK